MALAVAPGTLVTPRLVSNADWAEFLADVVGEESVAPPDHWVVERPPADSEGGCAAWTHLRTPLGTVPLTASAAGAWPVEVPLASALAFLRWKEGRAGAGGGRFRLPTEAELYCLDADLRAEAAGRLAVGSKSSLPPRNIDLRWHSPRSVASDAASGALGNVWQWAVDAAAATPSSSIALVGGSWASTGDRVTAARYNAASRVGPAYRAGGFRYVVDPPGPAAAPSAAHDTATAVVVLGRGEEGEAGAGAAAALLRAGWRVLLLQPPSSREIGVSASDAFTQLLSEGASALLLPPEGGDNAEALAAALSPSALPALRAVVLPASERDANPWRDRLWAALCSARSGASFSNLPAAAKCAVVVVDTTGSCLPPPLPAPDVSALRLCTLRLRFPLLPAVKKADAPSEAEPPCRAPAPPALPPGDGIGVRTFGRLVAALAQALTLPPALHVHAVSRIGGGSEAAAAAALAAAGEAPVLELADREAFLGALMYCEAQAL